MTCYARSSQRCLFLHDATTEDGRVLNLTKGAFNFGHSKPVLSVRGTVR